MVGLSALFYFIFFLQGERGVIGPQGFKVTSKCPLSAAQNRTLVYALRVRWEPLVVTLHGVNAAGIECTQTDTMTCNRPRATDSPRSKYLNILEYFKQDTEVNSLRWWDLGLFLPFPLIKNSLLCLMFFILMWQGSIGLPGQKGDPGPEVRLYCSYDVT